MTAQRRSESSQRVPVAITTVTGADLAATATSSGTAALRNVGSVQLRSNVGNSTGIYIRGIGSSLTSTNGDPAINFNVDGVYQLQGSILNNGLFDVSRIEVLKGPQGTLYGRNATGGSVNVITNDPTTDGLHGELRGQYGNFNTSTLEGVVNVPVTSTLAVRAAVNYNHHDAYLKDGYDTDNSISSRLKVLYQPSDAVRIVAAVDTSYWTSVIGDVLPATGNTNPASNRPWTNGYPYNTATPPAAADGQSTTPLSDSHMTLARVQADVDLGFGTLTVLPAYETYHSFFEGRLTGDYSSTDNTLEQTTVEARLASRASSTLKWVLGGFYLNSDQTQSTIMPAQQQTLLVPSANAKSKAVFGELTYPLTSTLSVTGGLRYTKDDKSQQRRSLGPAYVGGDTGIIYASQSYSALNYKIGAQWQFTSQNLLYAKYATAYKAGGFTTVDTIGPEHLRAWEVGSKNRFFNGRIELNASGFLYNYTGYQSQANGPYLLPNGQSITTSRGFNVTGNTPIKGVEAEAVARVGKGGRLTGSITYLNAHFGTFTPSATQNYTGLELPNVPRWQGRVGYQQSFDLPHDSQLIARVESGLQTGTWTRYTHVNGSFQSGYHKSDAYLTYKMKPWSIGGYVKNIENVAVMDAFAQGSLNTAYVQPPRTYGVQAGVSF